MSNGGIDIGTVMPAAMGRVQNVVEANAATRASLDAENRQNIAVASSLIGAGEENITTWAGVREATARMLNGGFPYKTYRSYVLDQRLRNLDKRAPQYVPNPDPHIELERVLELSHRIEVATGNALDKAWEDERWTADARVGRMVLYGAGLGVAGALAGIGAGLYIGTLIGSSVGPWGAIIGAAVGITIGIVLAIFPFATVTMVEDYRTLLSRLTPIERFPLLGHARRLTNHARTKNGASEYPPLRHGNQAPYTILGGSEGLAGMCIGELMDVDCMLEPPTDAKVDAGGTPESWSAYVRYCVIWLVGDQEDYTPVSQSRNYLKLRAPGAKNQWIRPFLERFADKTSGRVRADLSKDISLDNVPSPDWILTLIERRNSELRKN